ncbi:signal peptidase I (plasmid) [Halobacterium sp. MBLA0001]|uniref:signal peptidase I n=1 Tax=Halobacterium sp. MBLA0001 TaxID=3413511 RepID=UPI003C7853EA
MNRPSLQTAGKTTATLAVVAVLLTTVLVAIPGVIGADASYVVLSNSMEPALETGDVVIVQAVAPGAIEVGDVITYQRPPDADGGPNRVSHRVIDVHEADGELTYQTKGDANDAPDPYQVHESDLTGRIWFTIPYIGYLIRFIGTTAGILTFVVLPGILLVVTELYSVYQDATTQPQDEAG